MQKSLSYKLSITVAVLLILGMNSCTKEKFNLNDLNETIYVRHANADMPAYIHGNGSEKVFLIILHGGPGGNGLTYRVNSIRSEIEENNAIVYFDQRGSGSSQGNYSEEDVSLDLLAEDVLALAKVIRAKFGDDSKLFLMGHSWGGTLGPAVLLKDQSEFLGWIDVDGSHDPKGLYDEYKVVLEENANEQIAIGNSVDFWQETSDLIQNTGQNFSIEDFFKLNGAAHEGGAKFIEDNIVNDETADYGNNAPSFNLFTTNWNKNTILGILAFKRRHYETVSFTERLNEITIPSLVLWGKHDLVVPTTNAIEAFDNLGSLDKELFIFQNSAHSPMFNEPYLFSEKVIEFINVHK